jgi:hypothetical protein
MKIFPNGPNPCFTWILVICSYTIEQTTGHVNHK